MYIYIKRERERERYRKSLVLFDGKFSIENTTANLHCENMLIILLDFSMSESYVRRNKFSEYLNQILVTFLKH